MKKEAEAAPIKEPEEVKEKKIKLNNDIKDIRSLRQLDRCNLNLESPRLLQAMDDLGVSMDEMLKW